MRSYLQIYCLSIFFVVFMPFDRLECSTDTIPSGMFSSVEWRELGPFRGGRSAAVTGVRGHDNLYYMGSTGGGVWRTNDGGQTWKNISDGYFGGSIGSVEVAASDINVIYAGGGEVTVRGNVSHGNGVWKSTDAGKTWHHAGLQTARHIPRIRTHPGDFDLVYAAVLGDIYQPADTRGVYRSRDGGTTWENVLFVNENTGAVDLTLDPNNPRIIYATTWRVRRTPYSLESGGEGSALWKSTDGGDSWENISSSPGLPDGLWGISGVTVSPVNSERVWVIVENENGGVFRSDDAGKTWKKVNEDRALRQRAWYYSRIFADTQDEDRVYVVNVSYHISKDGGKSFEAYNAPHGDHHDLWIAPENNQRMIIGDDGGAQVSFDGGENWTTYLNQPTAQFYRVTTDNHFPYRIYGAQQDNSAIRLQHRTEGGSIGERAWESTAGGESAHLAIDPEDNDIVYGGSYGGYLTRMNHRTRQVQSINVYPDNPMGHGAEGMKYRFQWNFPLFFSPHDPDKLYTASNHLHVTYDEGRSWEVISPDLTTNDSTRLGPSGGPITKDNTGVEYYCTIFAACESPYEEGLIWCGSDDGLMHVSRDGGGTWQNVTPEGMPAWMMINSVEPDPFHQGGLYIAGTRYKLGDYKPYIYRTRDYGASWQRLSDELPQNIFTRVVRTDPRQEGLLYAGTEEGMYVSFDDGSTWQSLQLNLPIVPITDLAVKNDNLIAATQGRGFWMIDDLTVLHQLADDAEETTVKLFKPKDSYRMAGEARASITAGTNHPGGVMIHYYVGQELSDSVNLAIAILEADGDTICTFSTNSEEESYRIKEVDKGGNTLRWNMRYPNAKDFEGSVFWWGSLSGPLAVPGDYKVSLKLEDNVQQQGFRIIMDPRSESTVAELQEQFDFIQANNRKITEAHEAVIQIRSTRKVLDDFRERLINNQDDQSKAIISRIASIDSALTIVEENLYQTRNRSNQDPLNFPIKLTNKLAHLNSLYGSGNFPPTRQAYEVQEDLAQQIDRQLSHYYQVISGELPELNSMIRDARIEAVEIRQRKVTN